MLKIAYLEMTPGRQTLRLEGRVVGPWVEELRRSCRLIGTALNKVDLDLSVETIKQIVDRLGVGDEATIIPEAPT